MAIKHLTITELEDAGPRGSVWVLNSGPSSVYELSGDILLSIPGNAGQQTQALKIQATWLPQDLTAKFPKQRILESTDFRSAVVNELLTIISDRDAQRILAQDGAQEERRRITAEARSVREAGAARTIKDSNVEITRADGVKDDDDGKVDIYGPGGEEVSLAKAASKGLDTNDDGLTASFVMFAEKIGTEEDVKALNAIRTRSRFTRRELKYLRDNLRKHPKTVTALKARLSGRSDAYAALR